MWARMSRDHSIPGAVIAPRGRMERLKHENPAKPSHKDKVPPWHKRRTHGKR